MRLFLSALLSSVVLFPATVLPQAATPSQDSDISAHDVFASKPRELGAFVTGGVGTVRDDGTKFFNLGGRAGWVLTHPMGSGILQGAPEVAVEVIPFWQAYGPEVNRTGISIVPVNLRWNFTAGHKFVPWIQGAGGVVWTDHKFPYPPPDTSVWNFSPQFGVGTHLFTSRRNSLDFSANAVHYSSASLGDKNPGINAAVEFTLGYTWWK